MLEEEVKRLQQQLKNAEKKGDNIMIDNFEDEEQNDNDELEQMYRMNLEAKDAQIADYEEEIEELRSDYDLLKLSEEFLKKGMDNLNEQLHEKDLKLEFLDEAKECIRELNNKVTLLTEQKSSLEGNFHLN